MTNNGSSNRDDFLAPLGRLSLAVADAEGAAGELIVLQHPDLRPAGGEWSRSGAQLLKELRKCSTAPNFQVMCDHFEKLTPQRNLVFHGEWLFNSAGSPNAAVMKRNHDKATGNSGYVGSFTVTPGQINELVVNYERIFEGLSGYITDAMHHLSRTEEERLKQASRSSYDRP
jgi:hypothetical protein